MPIFFDKCYELQPSVIKANGVARLPSLIKFEVSFSRYPAISIRLFQVFKIIPKRDFEGFAFKSSERGCSYKRQR